MTIYIDADFKCHAAGGEGLTPAETEFFHGKCEAFLEGFRFVPAGHIWVRPDGMAFHGEMIAPWKPWGELEKAQREYEYQLLEEQNAGLLEAMAQMVEEVYNSDRETVA